MPRKPAPRKSTRRSTRKKQPSYYPLFGGHWLWFLAGILVGVILSLVIQLAYTQKESTNAGETTANEKKVTTQEEKKKKQLTFNFDTSSGQNQFKETQPVIIKDKRKPKKPAKADVFTPVLLQVGAFKRLEDADGQKAKLVLLNLSTRIQSEQEASGYRYRVLVGPFKQQAALDEAQQRLKSHGINSFVVKK